MKINMGKMNNEKTDRNFENIQEPPVLIVQRKSMKYYNFFVIVLNSLIFENNSEKYIKISRKIQSIIIHFTNYKNLYFYLAYLRCYGIL